MEADDISPRTVRRISAFALLGFAFCMVVWRYQACWVEPPFEVDFMPRITNIILAFMYLAYDGSEFIPFLLSLTLGLCLLFKVNWKWSLLICLVVLFAGGILCAEYVIEPDPGGHIGLITD